MARFEYTHYELPRTWDGSSIDYDYGVSQMDEMGANGWELVCIYDNIAYFKRACPDYDSVEENVSRIDTNVGNNQLLLREIRDLLQTLVDNTMPVSGGSLGALAQQAAKDTETDAPAPATDTEAMLCGFADEHVALALNGYEDADKSLELLAIVVGLAGLLLTTTAEEHHRHIVNAVYRYYQANGDDDKVKICFSETLNHMACYLSNAAVLTALNENAQTGLTLSDGIEIFFDVVDVVLSCEKNGTAPFVVDEMTTYVNLFIAQLKNQPDAVDEEMMNRVTAHIDHLREEYGLLCDTE